MAQVTYNQRRFVEQSFATSIILSGLFLICSAKNVLAEGSKSFGAQAHGVNRVVRTYTHGYAAISGSCSITMHLPKDRNGNYTRRVLDYIDKPSFYLGGKVDGVIGSDEFDGGIQHEGATRAAAVPGWAAFISHNSEFTNPQRWVVDANGVGRSTYWRAGTGNSTYQALKFSFIDNDGAGLVGLSVSGLSAYGSAFYWAEEPQSATATHHLAPYVGDICWNPVKSDFRNVKRVTAMTRDNGGSNLDGSWLQTDWRNCKAYLYENNVMQELNLTHEIVNPSTTGYDSPGGRGAGAYDRDGNYLNDALPKVDFPGQNISSDAARAPGANSEQATFTGVSRYTQEDVNIWLRDPKPIKKGR